MPHWHRRRPDRDPAVPLPTPTADRVAQHITPTLRQKATQMPSRRRYHSMPRSAPFYAIGWASTGSRLLSLLVALAQLLVALFLVVLGMHL